MICFFVACKDENKKNRLASASSPYLQQHADNPVDWYEWSDEALALAKKENKPLLVSVGYASCHWCHEMEKESFMDTAVARIMNENFICIKVDREERPDVDNLYMYACKLISGGGGWPLNAFALPDGKPFHAGTYYSKGSWKNLLTEISKAYKEKHELVVKQADALTKGIADESLSFSVADSQQALLTNKDYQVLFDSIYLKLDTLNGGLTGNVKFPMPVVTEFLLQYYYQTGNKQAIDAASTTLTKMALGGIYDHIGGGFARYSTDPEWHVPHFEKMLYDNAQLISLYSHAYQLTQNYFYKTIVTGTASFLEKELASPHGGFYSSLNADTENGEGEFYAWSKEQFKEITGNEDLIMEYFNVTAAGNWKKGKNVLAAFQTPAEYAEMKSLSPDKFILRLDKAKSRLLSERNKRTRPAIDTKILTSWNAILLKAYTDAYLATGEANYLSKALSIANFLEKNMLGNKGSLKRIFKDGKVSVEGFLDDYAWTAYAFLRFYQVSFDKHWLDLSKSITEFAINNFYDRDSKLFYYSSSKNSNLVVNGIETADEVIPSSNAIMATVVYSLGTIYDKSDYTELSKEMLMAVLPKMKKFPAFHAAWGAMAGLTVNGTYEIAVMGKDAIAKNRSLQKEYLPDCIMMGETDEENLPLLENKLLENKTMIYVCTNKVCKKPVEDVKDALTQIKNKL